MNNSRVCLQCGHPVREPLGGIMHPDDLVCFECGGFAVRHDGSGPWTVLLVSLGWWLAVIVAVFVLAWLMDPRKARADATVSQLKADIAEQAAATSKTEGAPDVINCFQTRRHGVSEVCITRAEWERQHAEDRTAQPAYRVGMRL